MRFNNLFTPKNNKPAPEYFLAVEIHESMIKSAVWQVENEQPSIVSLGSYELWDSEDSLINGVDASLTEATKGLAAPPDRVIFGLPDSWLVENKIHSTKQKLVQHLLKELKLKPIGLVTISEAIVQQLKNQEGIPPTAILLEIYPSKVIVSLVNVGQIQSMEEVGRSDDLARDVEEGLARIDVEKFPARFILTNGSDLENEEQQIISYPWTDKLPFLHLPKVQSLPIDYSIKAIALSGGTEAAKSLGLTIAEPDTPAPETTASILDTPAVDELEAAGFSLEETSPPPEEETLPEITVNLPPETEYVEETTEEIAPKIKPANLLSRIKPRFKLTLPQINFAPSRRLALLALPVIVILIFAGVVSYYFFLGQVNITLSLTPQRLNQDLDLTISSSGTADSLSVQATKKTLSGKTTDSVPTTGDITVGDKATGKIVIYSSGAINLKANTKITALKGNQTYTLDSAASIASSSADSCSLITPCTVAANVTAVKIGAEYNLDKDTKFNIENYDTKVLMAVADTAFTGGSSRAVKAVAKTDQEKVLGAATDKIKSDISDQLKANDPDSRFVSLGSLRYSAKNYDHSPGDEASTLSLDLEGQQDILVYSYNQMIDTVKQKVKGSVAAGFNISDKDIQINLSDPVEKDSSSFVSKAHIEALLIPVIDQSRIIEQTKGKKVEGLKSILEGTPGFKNAKIVITPDLPLISDYLPLNPKNIHFSISASL